ncbi:FGGY family carbohydrate kinase [Streptomyces sp. NPDC059916]|uniref:FGGY family carbohydrate kinase n=1 Tax=Streptomyces sp. NPDC059916 TaxID=3347001 RepID=UPI0036966C97
MWFLGIDIGTTHIKVAGVDEDGTPLPAGRIRTPTLDVDKLAFHDAEVVWRATAELIAEYARTTAAPHGPLGGAAVASFGQEESVAVDGAGRMLYPSLAWWERRPVRALDADTARWLDSFEQFQVSGLRHRLDQTPERTAHLRVREPELWRSTARWVDFCTFVTHRMTGEWVSATSQITHSQCFDLATLAPHAPVMERLGLTPGHFAPALPTGADAGEVLSTSLPGVALAPGARVVIGGHDQVVAARQVHSMSGAEVFDSIGTSEYLMIGTGTFDPRKRSYELGLDHERAWHDDGFLLGCPIPSGKVVQLLAELFHHGDFDRLFSDLSATASGSLPSLHVTAGPTGEATEGAEGLLTLAGVPAGARPAEVVRGTLDHLADLALTTIGEMCELAGREPGQVALMGSLFRRPEMAAHRRERWDLPLHISPLAEPVASGAAAIARDALTSASGPRRDHDGKETS